MNPRAAHPACSYLRKPLLATRCRPSSSLHRQNRGFSLTELLVAIAIIAVLMSLSAVAVNAARNSQKVNQTRVTIAKLDRIISDQLRRYDSRYITSAQLTAANAPSGNGETPSQQRAWYIRRNLINGDMPDRWADVAKIQETLAQRNYTKLRSSLQADPSDPASPDRDSAECLFMIIMLGGFEDGRTSGARGQLTLNEAGERYVETLRLARRYPTAKVIFTGGPASLILNQKSAGRAIGAAMRDLGLDASRVVLETASFNTWQNATMTRALVKPRPGQRFLLVTSAWHMPRSMGVFRKAGFEVDAWPVDYRTADTSDLIRPFGRVTEGLERVDFATKEWIGLVAYYLTGRSSALFPAP